MTIRVAVVLLLFCVGCDSKTSTPSTSTRTITPAERDNKFPSGAEVKHGMVTLQGVRLYLPDDVLGSRIGSRVEPLTKYIKTLEEQAAKYWSNHDFGDADGLLVAVGVKPGGESRAWCDVIGETIDDQTLQEFEEQLALVTPVPVNNGPIAFAIHFSFSDRTVTEFPELPQAWSTAARNAQRAMMIPDDLFAELWPDP